MKKLLLVSLVAIGFSISSCKKCATCTNVVPDSLGQDSTIYSEFCEKGKIYDNALYQYDRSGWTCSED